MEIILTSQNFDQEVIKSAKPVVVDVYAPWCGPCKMMGPVFEGLAKELSSKYVFGKLNIDEDREIAVRYNISSIPAFLFIKNGQVIGKETGYMSKETLEIKIKTYFDMSS
ncbi:MAG: Thioredoxin [candidate division TM6 bacterium GW2011_GWF2_37_49]|nr:MAG: Thioredoxin [candidate division TM6 bacterium GW2011_GWF2_37_49]